MSTREQIYILIAEGKTNKEIQDQLNISARSTQRYRREYDKGDKIIHQNPRVH